MLRIFDFLLMLYPAEFRAGFGPEMRAVFAELAAARRPGWGFWRREYFGLLRGAARERRGQLAAHAAPLAGGAVFASGLQFLLYWYLVPGKSKALSGVLGRLFSHVLLICVVVGVASSQQVRQDPETLELARGIYSRSFTALREAKTLDELRKLSDNLDAAEWISVDRFGRTILTKKDADRDLEALLALPPERRVTSMEILWAEQDAERLIVVAWMMPNETRRVDAGGASHQLTRATLIRDIFAKTEAGWRRIRHDKLTPNDTLVAVDGAAIIVPPMDEHHRVTPK